MKWIINEETDDDEKEEPEVRIPDCIRKYFYWLSLSEEIIKDFLVTFSSAVTLFSHVIRLLAARWMLDAANINPNGVLIGLFHLNCSLLNASETSLSLHYQSVVSQRPLTAVIMRFV